MRQIQKNKTNQFINDISNFNNKHIIQCKNKPISNIPEEPCYISSMTPNGLNNGQYEWIFYFNLSFQVIFVYIFFRQLIMNIDREKIIEDLDNRIDE